MTRNKKHQNFCLSIRPQHLHVCACNPTISFVIARKQLYWGNSICNLPFMFCIIIIYVFFIFFEKNKLVDRICFVFLFSPLKIALTNCHTVAFCFVLNQQQTIRGPGSLPRCCLVLSLTLSLVTSWGIRGLGIPCPLINIKKVP